MKFTRIMRLADICVDLGATLWGAGEFMIGAYQFDRVRIIMGLCLMILGTRKQRQS